MPLPEEEEGEEEEEEDRGSVGLAGWRWWGGGPRLGLVGAGSGTGCTHRKTHAGSKVLMSGFTHY